MQGELNADLHHRVLLLMLFYTVMPTCWAIDTLIHLYVYMRRKLEEVLTAKQTQILALIRLAKQQDSTRGPTGSIVGSSTTSFSTALGPEQQSHQADHIQESSRDFQQGTQTGAGTGLTMERSASVAWSSPSLPASSDDGVDHEHLEW
jgi:hypothetical protein